MAISNPFPSFRDTHHHGGGFTRNIRALAQSDVTPSLGLAQYLPPNELNNNIRIYYLGSRQGNVSVSVPKGMEGIKEEWCINTHEECESNISSDIWKINELKYGKDEEYIKTLNDFGIVIPEYLEWVVTTLVQDIKNRTDNVLNIIVLEFVVHVKWNSIIESIRQESCDNDENPTRNELKPRLIDYYKEIFQPLLNICEDSPLYILCPTTYSDIQMPVLPGDLHRRIISILE